MPSQVPPLPPGFVLGEQKKAGGTSLPPGFVPGEASPVSAPAPQKEGVLRGAKTFGEAFAVPFEDIMRSIAQGLTGGFADEIAAGAGALTGFPKAPEGEGSYEKRLEAQRARDEEIPLIARVPGEITGAIATGGLTKGVGLTANLGRAPELVRRLPGWAKAAGLGTTYGAIYGTGHSEGGTEERLKGMRRGAIAGAVLGPAGYAAGRGLEAGAGWLNRAIRSRYRPKVAADAAVRGAFARDEVTIPHARDRLRRFGPQATLADTGGPNVTGLTRAAGIQPGAAQNRIESTLRARAATEADRIAKATKKGLQPTEYYEAEDAFLRNMREKAAPLYAKAYETNQSIMTPRLKEIIEGGTGQSALRLSAKIVRDERASGEVKYMGAIDEELTAAMRMAREAGIRPPTQPAIPAQPGVSKGLSLETWDQIKRGFDELLKTRPYRNPDTGGFNQRGRAVIKMKKAMLRELDKATGGKTGAYATARALYAGEAEALGALRDGRTAINADPEVITRTLKNLSGSGAEAYRSGFARALKDIVDKTPDPAGIARRIWGNTRMRERLRAVFPDADSYRTFARALSAEIVFKRTQTKVFEGSRTTPAALEVEQARDVLGSVGALVASDAALGGMVVPGHALIRSRVGRKLGQAAFGKTNDEYFKLIARMLVSRNQAENQRVLDALNKLPADQQAHVLSSVFLILGGQTGGRVGAQGPSGKVHAEGE